MNETGTFMPVVPAGGGGFGGDMNSGWWVILLVLLMGGGLWGNGFGGNAGGFVGADVQRGFDQSAVMTGMGNIQNALNMANLSASQVSQTQQIISALTPTV